MIWMVKSILFVLAFECVKWKSFVDVHNLSHPRIDFNRLCLDEKLFVMRHIYSLRFAQKLVIIKLFGFQTGIVTNTIFLFLWTSTNTHRPNQQIANVVDVFARINPIQNSLPLNEEMAKYFEKTRWLRFMNIKGQKNRRRPWRKLWKRSLMKFKNELHFLLFICLNSVLVFCTSNSSSFKQISC